MDFTHGTYRNHVTSGRSGPGAGETCGQGGVSLTSPPLSVRDTSPSPSRCRISPSTKDS